MSPRPITPQEALAKLEELCSRSEQCTADIYQKLYRRQITGAAADDIVAQLVEGKWVDDSRFAAAFARDKYRFARWGRFKIRAALIAKRIPESIIAEAMEQIDAKEYSQIAFDTIKAKLRQLDRSDIAAAKLKLMRFATSRGYEAALTMRILNSRALWI